MVSRSGRTSVAAVVASILLSSLGWGSGVAVATADEPEVAGALESYGKLGRSVSGRRR